MPLLFCFCDVFGFCCSLFQSEMINAQLWCKMSSHLNIASLPDTAVHCISTFRVLFCCKLWNSWATSHIEQVLLSEFTWCAQNDRPLRSLFTAMRERGTWCGPLSVRLFICQTPILYPNGKKHHRTFSQLDSPIILVSSGHPQFQGALNTHGMGRICNLWLRLPFVSQTVQGRPMVAMKR